MDSRIVDDIPLSEADSARVEAAVAQAERDLLDRRGQRWCSYECGDCTNGVVVDVRVNTTTPKPQAVRCPCCGANMRFRGAWPAARGGFGARGDHDDLAEAEVDRLLSEISANIAAFCANPEAYEGPELPSLVGTVSYGGMMAALQRRLSGAPVSGSLRDFINSADHLAWCQYRDGFYDESFRCDCGLVASKRLVSQIR